MEQTLPGHDPKDIRGAPVKTRLAFYWISPEMHPFEVPLSEYIQPDWISSLPEERWHGWRREFFISETQFAWKTVLVWLSEARPGVGRDRRRTIQWVAYICKWSWANSDHTKARKVSPISEEFTWTTSLRSSRSGLR